MNIVDSINQIYILLLIAGSIYFLQKGHAKRREAQVLKFRNYHRQEWLRKNRPNKVKNRRDKL